MPRTQTFNISLGSHQSDIAQLPNNHDASKCPPPTHASPLKLTQQPGLPLHLPPRCQHPRHRYPSFPSPVQSTVLTHSPQPGNFGLLPLRTKTRGPAYTLPPLPPDTPPQQEPDPDSESYDPLDEVLSLFRANTFFRNFEIKGPADRLLIYGILFVSELLGKVKPGVTKREAEKAMLNLALDTQFAIPGDAGFPLNQAFEAPGGRADAETLRQ